MRTRIINAISTLPLSIQQTMMDMVSSTNFDATISKDDFSLLMTLSGYSDPQLRLALLSLASAYSIAPISNFNVGAIARGQSGRLYLGANMEFNQVQLNQSVHAEQSAICHAWLKGETKLIDITVNYSPCGHCRQFMNELNGAKLLKIQLPQKEEKTLHDYLPESFGPQDLNVTHPLLQPKDHALTCPDSSLFAHAALSAANRSHAPYSLAVSGLALMDNNERIFSGMYAENAAFNPSLAPLQMALVAMNLANIEFKEIKAAILVEKANAVISHKDSTRSLLNAIKPDINLKVIQV